MRKKSRMPTVDEIMTISLAAELLGVTKQAAHQMAKDGRLESWKIPSAGSQDPVVVRRADVERMKPTMQTVADVLRAVG